MTNRCPVQRLIVLLPIIAFAWPLVAKGQDVSVPPATHVPEATAAQSRHRELGTDHELDTLLLVRSTGGRAVVRFGNAPLEIVTIGDRLGRNRAEIIEIGAKRLVLDERFTGRDGAPNRAQIVLRDGERGGTRYLERLDESVTASRRPVSLGPGIQAPTAKGAAEKPPK